VGGALMRGLLVRFLSPSFFFLTALHSWDVMLMIKRLCSHPHARFRFRFWTVRRSEGGEE
jgi:hypothetical protein